MSFSLARKSKQISSLRRNRTPQNVDCVRGSASLTHSSNVGVSRQYGMLLPAPGLKILQKNRRKNHLHWANPAPPSGAQTRRVLFLTSRFHLDSSSSARAPTFGRQE